MVFRRLVSSGLFVLATPLILGGVASAELSTVELEANDLTFNCTQLTSSEPTATNVILLHGYPNRRSWYDPLLELWDTNETIQFNALACDLRGYSPGASPDVIEEYSYDIFASDVAALAEAVGYSEYHLVGHDHGAGLGWLVASEEQSDTVLSYTAMSVPHADLFSDRLCGEQAAEDQVSASNYFNQLSHPESVTDEYFQVVGPFFGFETAADLQKATWWYYGSIPRYMALPRVLNDTEVAASGDFVMLARATIPFNNEPRDCVPQEKAIGAIDIPVLMVCGGGDVFLLCTDPYYVNPDPEVLPDYQYYNAETCGHDFFLETDCTDAAASNEVMTTITDFILASSTEGDTPTGAPSPEDSTSVARQRPGAVVALLGAVGLAQFLLY